MLFAYFNCVVLLASLVHLNCALFAPLPFCGVVRVPAGDDMLRFRLFSPPATLRLNQSKSLPQGSAAVSLDKPEHSQPENVTSGRSETLHHAAHVLISVFLLH